MKRLETRFMYKDTDDTSEKMCTEKRVDDDDFLLFLSHRDTQQLRRNLETNAAEAPIYIFIL